MWSFVWVLDIKNENSVLVLSIFWSLYSIPMNNISLILPTISLTSSVRHFFFLHTSLQCLFFYNCCYIYIRVSSVNCVIFWTVLLTLYIYYLRASSLPKVKNEILDTKCPVRFYPDCSEQRHVTINLFAPKSWYSIIRSWYGIGVCTHVVYYLNVASAAKDVSKSTQSQFTLDSQVPSMIARQFQC